ncbi:beta-lactamase family protein [Sphingomonas sp. HDW15A]|uniref:serine hydrolase domain-containing protein n=1 Tax=Sphingomonas sp. HDW15A TaxID=2714942 RepID=UPI00140AFD02|nr:serine hydrolase domain-containing protein [Sphingomonas sp. HDW15A]QIK96026.1 beta-lactamase family protein [Sphingomonas sp. HDW15A]
MSRHFLAASLLAGVSTASWALPADFKANADKIVAMASTPDGPGYAVVITENGKTVYRNERGFANIESKVPISPATSFRFASITKQFTAAAIMKLVDQGKISLDDPVTKYLPDYPGPGGAATVRQLLNHTSGIMPYTQIPSWVAKADSGASATTQSLIDEFKAVPLQFKPGEQYSYNNSGYVLLGAILEKLTGKSWDEAIVSTVTGPLGLKSIMAGVHEPEVKAMAVGYTDEEGKTLPAPAIHMSNPHAAGALIGTADDLVRWGNALHGGKVLSPASYALMTSAQKLKNGESIPYGFGLAPSDVRGRKTIGHNGNIHGFATGSMYVVEPKIFIVVLGNSDAMVDASTLATRLAAVAVGDPFPEFTARPVDKQAVTALLGSYALPVGERLFFERGGKLYTRRSGGGEREVFPAGDDRFFYGSDGLTWFAVRTGTDGKKVMEMHHDGASQAELSTWAGPVPAEKAAVVLPVDLLDSYAGSYSSPIGNFLITRSEGTLSVKLGNQPLIALKAVSMTEFEVAQVGAKLTFGRIIAGKAQTMTLDQNGQSIEAKRQ